MQTESSFEEKGTKGSGFAAKPSANGASVGARSDAPGELHNVLTDIEELITTATSLTGEDLARAKAKITARITAARKSIEMMGGAVADRARHTVKATDNYVHEQPWQAIGIGAALGLVIGFVLARRG